MSKEITVTKFKGIVDILEFFREKKTCIKYLEYYRWRNGIKCPHCNYDKVYRTNRGYKCADKHCLKKFSVTSGSIFGSSKIELKYWFAAIYIITAHKKGISSHQLARDLGVCQKTAWFINHRIRAMMHIRKQDMLSTVVEVDETYVGGKRSNKHGWQRKELADKYGLGGSAEKTPVIGMIERQGQIRTMSVKQPNGETIKPLIHEHIEKGTRVMTDTFGAYYGLNKDYKHEIINHSQGEYVLGDLHTNSIENFWSLFKRGIFGIYHHVSPKHIDRYCQEFSFRFNSRKLTDKERFENAITHCEKRLKWDELIEKTEIEEPLLVMPIRGQLSMFPIPYVPECESESKPSSTLSDKLTFKSMEEYKKHKKMRE